MGRKRRGDEGGAAAEDFVAYEEPEVEEPKRLHRSVQRITDIFDISDKLAWELDEVMEDRREEFSSHSCERDLQALHDELEKSENPAGCLVAKMKDLSEGRFITKAESYDAVVKFAKGHGLDRGATEKLIDAMAVRERKFGEDVIQDLKILSVHLENSNAPSKLISMRLKDIRAGYKLGHCVYARAKELCSAPDQGGPSIEGHRSQRPRSGYTDIELAQRFIGGSSNPTSGGVVMTEAEAKAFQRSMRSGNKEEPEKVKSSKVVSKSEAGKDKKKRSRSKNTKSRDKSIRASAKSRDKSKSRKRKSRSRKKGSSKERKRGRSRDRSKSRSKSRKRSRSKRRSRSRKRSRSKSRKRSKS